MSCGSSQLAPTFTLINCLPDSVFGLVFLLERRRVEAGPWLLFGLPGVLSTSADEALSLQADGGADHKVIVCRVGSGGGCIAWHLSVSTPGIFPLEVLQLLTARKQPWQGWWPLYETVGLASPPQLFSLVCL